MLLDAMLARTEYSSVDMGSIHVAAIWRKPTGTWRRYSYVRPAREPAAAAYR